MLRNRGRFVKVEITATVEGQVAVSGEFTCAVVDPAAIANEGAAETS